MSSPKTLLRPAARRTTSSFRSVAASVDAFAHIAADLATIDGLRRNPGPVTGRDLPASFLKYADEQSVCGFAAVLKAIHAAGQPIDAFKDWAVIGAPRYPGRLQAAATISRFLDQGVRGVSPHTIPQTLLHSPSALISVGLGMNGPNLGAGGGQKALSEGMMTALAMLDEGRIPGLWLVVSQWDPEPIPAKNGRITTSSWCHAVAMALTPVDSGSSALRLELTASLPAEPSVDSAPVVTLAEALADSSSADVGAVVWQRTLEWGARLALIKHAT